MNLVAGGSEGWTVTWMSNYTAQVRAFWLLTVYTSRRSRMASSDTKVLHRLIRFVSDLAVNSFFTEVRVIGGEHVPKEGPIIV